MNHPNYNLLHTIPSRLISHCPFVGLFFLLTSGLLLICCGIFVTVFQPYDFIFKWVSNRRIHVARAQGCSMSCRSLQKLLFADDGEIFQLWERPPVNLYLKVYLFNITNHEAFMAGRDKKINVEEVGPYVYR